jgi:2-dehydropantoate 2-reductase
LAASIAIGDIPCQTTDTIEKDLWAKMLFNCTLNPLGTILDVPYGALAGHDSTRDLMDRIVEEIFRVLQATGYKTHWTEPTGFLEVFYGRLIPDTALHRSSTLQDIRLGKRTEIEALNGAVIRLAQRHGLDVPCNLAVYHLIRFMESRIMGGG